MHNVFDPKPLAIRAKRLIITETRDDYQDVFTRNFSINLTHKDLSALEEMVHPSSTVKNYLISESEVVSKIPNIIGMSNSTSGMANISNGWQVKRGRFILEVEIDINGNTLVYVIQGYTDYLDVSISGHLDPNIMFYINSITHLQRYIHPRTKQLVCHPLSSFDIIRSNGRVYTEYSDIDTQHLIRPVDIITQLYTDDELANANTHINTVSVLNKDVASKKQNNNPLSYFTNTINSFTGAKMEMSDTIIAGDILKNASVHVGEPRLLENQFINMLYNITGDTFPTTFKLSDIQKMDANIANNVTVISRDGYAIPESHNTILDTNDTMSTLNPTFENKQVTLIVNMLPSIMSDCLLGKLDLSLTNTNITEDIVITDARSLVDGLDPLSMLPKLKNKIAITLFPLLSIHGQMRFETFISCNLFGDMTICIQYFNEYNNNPPFVYRFPLFASGVYSPVIGNDVTKQTLTNDFGTIFDNNFQYNQHIISMSGQPNALNNTIDPKFTQGGYHATNGLL